MFGIVKAEMLKSFRRKGFFLLLAIAFLPVLYLICTFAEVSYIIDLIDTENGFFNFFVQNVKLSCELLLFPVMIALSAIHIQRGEIDSRSIRFYLQRVGKRSSIYFAKHIAIVISILLVCLLLFISCWMCFCVIRSHQSGVDMLDCSGTNGNFLEVALLISLLSYLTMIVFIAFTISTIFNVEVATGVIVLIIVLLACIKEIPILQLLSPIFYMQQLSSNTGIFTTGQSALIAFVLTIFTCPAAYRIGCRKFSKYDI